MIMHASQSLPVCFASLDALAHSSNRVFSGSLHRRISAVSNVLCQPKTEHISPTVATTDLPTSRTVSSDLGDEEVASTEIHLNGLACGRGSGWVRRL